MHQVVWTKKVYTFFCEHGNLNDLEREILAQRISGMTVLQMSFYHSMSESSIHRLIKRLRHKYDVVQKEYPNELRPRKSSTAETYMDTH